MGFDIILTLGRLLRGDIGIQTYPVAEPEVDGAIGRGRVLRQEDAASSRVVLPAMPTMNNVRFLIPLGRHRLPGDFDRAVHEDEWGVLVYIP